MRLEGLAQGAATDVVADARVCLTFSSRQTFPADRINTPGAPFQGATARHPCAVVKASVCVRLLKRKRAAGWC
ncbi:MAG: hypothetical protein ACYDD1_16250 [Caulobacteraceae bacterium]